MPYPLTCLQVRAGILKDGKLNADIVGQHVYRLAEIFGITVPEGTKVLIGEVDVIGHSEAFAHEKLCPILGA